MEMARGINGGAFFILSDKGWRRRDKAQSERLLGILYMVRDGAHIRAGRGAVDPAMALLTRQMYNYLTHSVGSATKRWEG